MTFEYYYNDVPGKGLCRNNLIYTSLISTDKKVFCQWYHNDTVYHQGQNEVVDPAIMDEKWNREVQFLTTMTSEFIPKILDINDREKKIYLSIDGVDFWQRSLNNSSYNEVLPDWQEQMLTIIKEYRRLGWYKYSMHPSSYFIVDGRLKSINYFFTYQEGEPLISIKDVESHIYSTRQEELKKYTERMGISWSEPQSFTKLQHLCFESFRKNYPNDFINKAREIYND